MSSIVMVANEMIRDDLRILIRLQNAAYTDGFMAGKTPVRSHMFK